MKSKILSTPIVHFTIVLCFIISFKANGTGDSSKSLFTFLDGDYSEMVNKDIRNAVFLTLDFVKLKQLKDENNPVLELEIPISSSSSISLNLRTAKVLADNFVVKTNNNKIIDYTPGLYYQGTVFNQTNSIAGVSFFDDSFVAVFSFNNENYTLGLWESELNREKNIYILYKDSEVQHPKRLSCGVEDNQEKRLGNNNGNHLQSNQCIKVYFECDYQMYQDKGNSTTNVVNYVTAFFNITQQIYLNEMLNVEISEVYVWTTTDPYVSNSTSNDYLNNFQSVRTSFNGNVAQLLTTRTLGLGGLAYLDVICSPSNAYGFSNIENTYQPYPNYSNTIFIVTHELGHNFGSHHTHWCGWPGGAIDDCYQVEGGCSPGPHPTNLGTIMSYCNLNIGVIFSNGFGPLPGGAIRAAYNAASCLTACVSPPKAQFAVSDTISCTLPKSITFTDQSTFGPTHWSWDFDGDGIVDDTTQSPTHNYTLAGIYSVRLVVSNSNGQDSIVKTAYIALGPVTPSVSIAITAGNDTICQNTSVTFTATPVNGGSPTYQWRINGSAVPGETNATFTSTTLANNAIVTCQMTSSSQCANPASVTSTGITMHVSPNVTPEISISISSGNDTICVGQAVSFASSVFFGGTNPVYDWKVGGTSVGNSSSFTSTSLANGDIVTCTLTSNADCATPAIITSTGITMTVEPVTAPTVSIAVSSGTIPTCPGTPVTFTATNTNGGSTPSYQWQSNGNNTALGSTYTPISPSNGDVITCVITSNASCLSIPTATSNSITISFVSPIIPSASIAITNGTNPVCVGDSATFHATATNAGGSPTYQWLLNGFPITGAQSANYTPPTITNGDVLSCEVTSSDSCAQTVTSNTVALTVVPVSSIVFVSDIDVCAGEITETVFNTNPSGATVTWTNSNPSIGLSASGAGNVPTFTTSNTGTTPDTATITVVPSISNCPGTPSSYSITIEPTPEISVAGTTLTATAAGGYQWYFNGSPIPGATNQTYIAMQNGEYSVIVDNSDCPSASVTVTTAGIEENGQATSFLVYPNPNDGNFSLFINVLERGDYTFKITNALGAIVYTYPLNDLSGQYTQQVAVSELAKGVYFVSLENGGTRLVKRIVLY